MTDALKAAFANRLKPGEEVRWSELYTPPKILFRHGVLYAITNKRVLFLRVDGGMAHQSLTVKLSRTPAYLVFCKVTRSQKSGTTIHFSSGETADELRTRTDEAGLLAAFMELKATAPSAASQLGFNPEWMLE